MKKRLLAAAVAGAVMLSAGAQAQDSAAPEGYQLQQVLINKIQTIDEIQSTETLISLQNPIMRTIKP